MLPPSRSAVAAPTAAAKSVDISTARLCPRLSRRVSKSSSGRAICDVGKRNAVRSSSSISSKRNGVVVASGGSGRRNKRSARPGTYFGFRRFQLPSVAAHGWLTDGLDGHGSRVGCRTHGAFRRRSALSSHVQASIRGRETRTGGYFGARLRRHLDSTWTDDEAEGEIPLNQADSGDGPAGIRHPC